MARNVIFRLQMTCGKSTKETKMHGIDFGVPYHDFSFELLGQLQ